MPVKLSEYIGLSEAAKRATVTRQAVYGWVNRGRLPAYNVAGRKAVLLSDLDALVTERDAPRARRFTKVELEIIEVALRKTSADKLADQVKEGLVA